MCFRDETFKREGVARFFAEKGVCMIVDGGEGEDGARELPEVVVEVHMGL